MKIWPLASDGCCPAWEEAYFLGAENLGLKIEERRKRIWCIFLYVVHFGVVILHHNKKKSNAVAGSNNVMLKIIQC